MGILSNISTALTHPIVGTGGIFHSIDMLRGLSAIAILVFHYGHFTMGNGTISLPPERLSEVSLYWSLGYIRTHGALAVMMFWMISGFVFMHVYAGKSVTGWEFFAIRFARLYPLHFLTLLLVAAIQWASMGAFGHYLIYQINDAWHFVLNLFMASEWGLSEGNSFNGPIWSVSAEILIYVLFWLYIRAGFSSLLSSGLLALAFLALFMVFRISVILCGAYFFAGATLYAAFSMIPAPRYRWALIASLISLVAWAGAFAMGMLAKLPLTFTLLGLFAPVLLALALSERIGLAYKRFRAVGDLTYSTYLWHSPLQMLFLAGAAAGLWSVDIVLTNGFFIAYLIAMCLFGYASFDLIEKRARDWLRMRMLGAERPVKVVAAP